jgi:hypothetical protein
LYESVEGERRGIVEEKVADVIEEESERQTDLSRVQSAQC